MSSDPAGWQVQRNGTDPELEAVLATDWIALAEQVRATSPCVLWTGAIDRSGYGKVGGHRRQRAHRVAWERERGPIPPGLTIDHTCRVRSCVNVDHLEVVTMRTNALRGTSPAALNARRTTCIRGHSLADARRLRSGRRCRWCFRDTESRAAAVERVRRWRARRKAEAQGAGA